MDTTAESTFALIEEVRKRPFLYSEELYQSRARLDHNEAWKEISKALGTGVFYSKLKSQWSSLRSKHARFLRVGYRIKLPGVHERLSFLDPYMLRNQGKSTNKEAIKYEEGLESAIELVKNVQKFPCLYNGSDFNALDAAWNEVAAKLGSGTTAQGCMQRWKRLRYFYKYSFKNGNSVKPEGIAPHLAFLKPFVDNEPDETEEYTLAKKLAGIVRQYPELYKGSKPEKQISSWKKVAKHMGNNVSADFCIKKWKWLRGKYERHLRAATRMEPYGIDRHLKFLNAFVKEKAVRKKPLSKSAKVVPSAIQSIKHLNVDETDKDAQFLLKFLETMAKMSKPQKRLFRIGAVKASRAVLDCD